MTSQRRPKDFLTKDELIHLPGLHGGRNWTGKVGSDGSRLTLIEGGQGCRLTGKSSCFRETLVCQKKMADNCCGSRKSRHGGNRKPLSDDPCAMITAREAAVEHEGTSRDLHDAFPRPIVV